MIPARIVKDEVYNPRTPRKNQYYRCVEAHYEELAGVWDDRYQRDYGYWRPYVLDVIYKYLDCGDLHLGFARVPAAASLATSYSRSVKSGGSSPGKRASRNVNPGIGVGENGNLPNVSCLQSKDSDKYHRSKHKG